MRKGGGRLGRGDLSFGKSRATTRNRHKSWVCDRSVGLAECSRKNFPFLKLGSVRSFYIARQDKEGKQKSAHQKEAHPSGKFPCAACVFALSKNFHFGRTKHSFKGRITQTPAVGCWRTPDFPPLISPRLEKTLIIQSDPPPTRSPKPRIRRPNTGKRTFFNE